LPPLPRALSALDPAAIDRVRGEALPEPRDASELHDLLMWLGVTRPREAWAELLAALVADGRAVKVLGAGASAGEGTEEDLWCALERRAHVEALFPEARFAPDAALPPALASAPRPDRDAAARDVVRGHLDTSGPVVVPELCAATRIDRETIQGALNQLELEGLAMRGRFDTRAAEDGEPQWCARRLLSRIHAYTQERLRRDIEPVTPQDFMRFLLRWQHVAPGTQLHGQAGVLRVIEQLQGFELAAGAWEKQVLSARIDPYRPEWLDALCLSGQVTWGRLGRPAARAEEELESARQATLSRATPTTLAIRGDWHWLAARVQAQSDAGAALDAATEQVLGCLRERGALFFSELAICSGLREDALREALWDGVARGLVTADGYGALRNLLAPAPRWAAASAQRRFGLRSGARGAALGEGRWALAPAALPEHDQDELAEAVAEQLLARWGVVFRDLLVREPLAVPYRDVAWALRRLEARGLVRGGRFVSGFVGEQYALPDAVEQLREVRRSPRDGALVRLSACDPLNLTAVILPGPRVPALRANVVSYRDGALVADHDAIALARPELEGAR
jgi:ATP-dependent Lhr-like helicase